MAGKRLFALIPCRTLSTQTLPAFHSSLTISSPVIDRLAKKWLNRVGDECSETALKQRIKRLLDFGVDGDDLDSAVQRCPGLLMANAEEKLKDLELHFDELGIGKKCIARMLSFSPDTVLRDDFLVLNLRHMSEFATRYGLDDSDISKMFSRSPLSLIFTSESRLKSIGEFLEEHNIRGPNVRRIAKRRPGFFSRSAECLKDRVEFLADLGMDHNSGTFLTALTTACGLSMETLKTRFNYLLSLDIPEKEMYRMVKLQPRILAISSDQVEEKITYALKTMKYPLDEISRAPVYLLYSLEKRIKPRYRVLTFLQDKEIIKRKFALGTIVGMSSPSFVSRFVVLHPDAATLYKDDNASTCLEL